MLESTLVYISFPGVRARIDFDCHGVPLVLHSRQGKTAFRDGFVSYEFGTREVHRLEEECIPPDKRIRGDDGVSSQVRRLP